MEIVPGIVEDVGVAVPNRRQQKDASPLGGPLGDVHRHQGIRARGEVGAVRLHHAHWEKRHLLIRLFKLRPGELSPLHDVGILQVNNFLNLFQRGTC